MGSVRSIGGKEFQRRGSLQKYELWEILEELL